MPTAAFVLVTIVVLIGVAGYLLGTLLISIRKARQASNITRIWANFGLSIAFCVLFLVSWAAHAFVEWGAYRSEQLAHGEPVDVAGYIVQFGQATLENWQSEFLQLFSFVVLSALLIHHGSAESKDGDDRMERKIDEIAKRLDELAPRRAPSRG